MTPEEKAAYAKTFAGQAEAFAEALRNLGAVLAASGTRIAEFFWAAYDRVVAKSHPAEVECIPGAHDDVLLYLAPGYACPACGACV